MLRVKFFVIPTLGRDLKFEEDEEEGGLSTNYTDFTKRIIRLDEEIVD